MFLHVAMSNYTSSDVLHVAMSNYTSSDVLHVAMSNYTSSDVFLSGNEQLYVELQKLDCVFADELAVVLLADGSVFDHFV